MSELSLNPETCPLQFRYGALVTYIHGQRPWPVICLLSKVTLMLCESFFIASLHSSRASGFLARDSIYAIARYMPSPVRLSVCLSVPLSVTRVDQSKTVEVRITQPSPQSSPMTLVS